MDQIKGKRFLICQPMIDGLCGSTIVTLDLGDYLQKNGASVVIYTNHFDDPAKHFFEQKQLKVLTFENSNSLKLSDFDYIWVHSQILPISIIKDLGKNHSNLPAFIFLHMSSLYEQIPDEFMWIYDLENRLASMQLYISEGTKRANLEYANINSCWDFFRNPAPVDFKYRQKAPNKELSNVLIVSNHPPKEILEAKSILKDQGFNVVSLGDYQDKYSLLSPELISDFDVVITIGKTVQYCLASGTPVYIYDHYGGPGYLNCSNFNAAKKTNFSGCCCRSHKTPSIITKELINGYGDALIFHKKNQEKFQNFASIDNVLPDIIKKIKPKKITPFDESYIKSVVAAETFAKIRFQIGGESVSAIKNLSNDLNITKQQLIIEQERTNIITSAKSYKLYKKLMTPYNILKKEKK